jgi:hypothetical protein
MSEAKAAGVIPCESCGAELEFQIGQKRVACPHCRHARAIAAPGEIPDRDLNEVLVQRAAQRASVSGAPGRAFLCGSCGARTTVEAALTGGSCSACRATLPSEPVHAPSARLPIDGFLPFRISLEEARHRIRTWRETLAFAPTCFAPAARLVDGLQALYLPFWCFDAFASCSGSFQHFVDDMLVPATADLPETALHKLEPWPLEQLRPYDSESLAGVQARAYDVELEIGFARCRERVREQLAAVSDLEFAAPRYRQLLLPVYRVNGAHPVVLNGVTGALASSRPYTVLQRIQRLVGLEAWRRRR